MTASFYRVACEHPSLPLDVTVSATSPREATERFVRRAVPRGIRGVIIFRTEQPSFAAGLICRRTLTWSIEA